MREEHNDMFADIIREALNREIQNDLFLQRGRQEQQQSPQGQLMRDDILITLYNMMCASSAIIRHLANIYLERLEEETLRRRLLLELVYERPFDMMPAFMAALRHAGQDYLEDRVVDACNEYFDSHIGTLCSMNDCIHGSTHVEQMLMKLKTPSFSTEGFNGILTTPSRVPSARKDIGRCSGNVTFPACQTPMILCE